MTDLALTLLLLSTSLAVALSAARLFCAWRDRAPLEITNAPEAQHSSL